MAKSTSRTNAAEPLAIRKAVGVYILDEAGRMLFIQRSPAARHEHYKWEAPGGEVEPGETFEAAAIRELQEELGVDITITGTTLEYKSYTDVTGQNWETRIFTATITQPPVICEPGKCVGLGWFSYADAVRLNVAHHCRVDLERLEGKDLLKTAKM